MLTAKNPDFETIAKVLQFIEENRSLVEAYQNYQAEEAYRKHREKLIQEQESAISEKDSRIAELERALAKHKPLFISKLAKLFSKR